MQPVVASCRHEGIVVEDPSSFHQPMLSTVDGLCSNLHDEDVAMDMGVVTSTRYDDRPDS